MGWMGDRFYWADVFSELRRILMTVEQNTKTALRTDSGVWIEQLLTAAPRAESEMIPGVGIPAMPGGPDMSAGGADAAAAAAFRRRYGLEGPSGIPSGIPQAPVAEQPPQPPPQDGSVPDAGTGVPKPPRDTNEIAVLTLTFRAVSLKNVSGQPDADKNIAYSVMQELRSSPYFDPDPQETHTTSEVMNDEQTGTFTFSVVARLKHPLKL
jgi:hypothetical protein